MFTWNTPGIAPSPTCSNLFTMWKDFLFLYCFPYQMNEYIYSVHIIDTYKYFDLKEAVKHYFSTIFSWKFHLLSPFWNNWMVGCDIYISFLLGITISNLCMQCCYLQTNTPVIFKVISMDRGSWMWIWQIIRWVDVFFFP